MPVLVSGVDNGTDHGTDHGTGAGINPPLARLLQSHRQMGTSFGGGRTRKSEMLRAGTRGSSFEVSGL